jgi:vacuolar-type H+-ATPase subunit E/Vma4
MGHEELARYLIRSGETRREEILALAREQAERALAEAGEKAKELERDFLEALEREVEEVRRTASNRADLEAREWALKARARLVEEVFARLSDRLARLPRESGYPRVAEGLFREVAPELPPGKIVLRADPATRAVLELLLSGREAVFSPLPEGEMGGLEASDEAGTVHLRNTLKVRLAKAWPDLLVEVRRGLLDP